jgi:hypothetical protein
VKPEPLRASLPDTELPWRRPRREVLLLALVAVAALSPVYPQDSQDPSRLCLTAALAHARLSADSCLSDVFDRASHGGHLYSDKAPGLSILELPSERFLGLGSAPEKWPAFYLQLWGIRLLSVGLLFVLSAFLVGRVAEGLAPGYGSPSLVAFALGTMTTPLAATGFSHVATGGLLFSAFVLAWSRRPALAGLAAGVAALTDYTALIPVALIGLYVALRGARAAAGYTAGVLPGLAVLGLYDWAAFGAPWHASYRYVDNFFAGRQTSGLFGIGTPHLMQTFQVFAGPGGLLVVSPVLVIAALGLLILRRDRPAEAALAAVVFLVYLLLNCSYFLPYGGLSPGPRFLVPGLPFLALGLGPGFRRLPRTAAVATALSVASITAIVLVWPSNSVMRGTVWGELVRVPSQLGASRFVQSLTETILHEAGAGASIGALAVVVPAAAAVGVALAGLPWTDIRAARRHARPRLGPVAAGTAAVYLVAAADVSAAASYPFGNRTAGRAIEIANIETRLTASSTTARRGDHVNFSVVITSHESVTAERLVLTITLTPGLRLDGRPAYSIGSGCVGTTTIVCNLDYLPAYNATNVYLGVTVTGKANQTVTAKTTTDGITGYVSPKTVVSIRGSTTYLPGS